MTNLVGQLEAANHIKSVEEDLELALAANQIAQAELKNVMKHIKDDLANWPAHITEGGILSDIVKEYEAANGPL